MRTVTAMTKTNDTISRAAALSVLNGCTEIYLNNLPPTIYKTDAVEAVTALPPAQPGCEDAVSRADVDILIEEAQTAWLKGDILLMYPALKKGLQKVPSVTPKQPGWIPCTPETMPTMTDTYLVKVGINENGEGMHTEVRTAEWNVIWQTWYVHTTHCFVGDIIKWMPIPREGRQDNA